MSTQALAAVIIIIISGFLVFKNLPINQPQPTSDKGFQASMNYPSPSPSPTPSPSFKSSIKATPKASASPSPSPSPSQSPTGSPTAANNSPTPTPSPVAGVYKLDCGQNCSFSMKVNQGYAVGATLQDSNGKNISYQSDFEYIWSIDDTSLGDFKTFDTCLEGVSSPCPFDHAVLNAYKSGSSTIRLKVKNKSDGKIVGETNFNVTVN